ncbi:MAG: hydantoinase/oxoprolinase family protein [Microthrixaceae bacterium]
MVASASEAAGSGTGSTVRVGVDTGGTFTDVVGADGTVLKLASTPHDPGEAIRQGVARLMGNDGAGAPAPRPAHLAHGTTVATNAVLEGTLARVALLGTAGFADLIEIGRQNRPSLADHDVDRPDPLVGREDRLEVAERMSPTGAGESAPELDRLPEVPAGVEALAVCLLHADLNAEHERLVARAYRERGWDVTASHELSPLFREFERASTTVVNAALRPRVRRYLEGLSDVADRLWVMTSAGGLWPLTRASEAPAGLALSGPAGGVRAAAIVAGACGYPDVVSFDMGGTSTDVCLITGGAPAPAGERNLVGHPVRLPSLDVITVGAGGGSIAAVDSGGALTVGPRSAGSVPGPVAYGRGGTEPTVTDANVALGRIPAEGRGGLGRLDVDGAVEALERSGVSAEGVLEVVTANMEGALRSVSVARGVDPTGLALVAFGGAGPLHACDLAQSLGMRAVIVPPMAGVLSAVGILGAPERHDLTRSWPTPLDHAGLPAARRDLEAAVLRAFDPAPGPDPGAADDAADDDDGDGGSKAAESTITVTSLLSCRYAGQSHEIEVGDLSEFGAVHERRNGYRLPDAAIEVVSLRAFGERPAPADVLELLGRARPVGADRLVEGELHGPASVAAEDHTVWIPEGWIDAGAAGLTAHLWRPPGRPGSAGVLASPGGGSCRRDGARIRRSSRCGLGQRSTRSTPRPPDRGGRRGGR